METEKKRFLLRTALSLILTYDFKEEVPSYGQRTLFFRLLSPYRYRLPKEGNEKQINLLENEKLREIIDSFFGGRRFQEAMEDKDLVEICNKIGKLTSYSEKEIEDWLNTELIQSEK